MSSNLPPPPKFGPIGPAPQSPEDWTSFFRWLTGLWRGAAAGISAPQSVALGARLFRSSDQETLGAAQAFALAHLAASAPGEFDAAAGEVFARMAPSAPNEFDAGAQGAFSRAAVSLASDDLTSLLAYVLAKPQYPAAGARGAVVRDTHANRVNYPAASYDGFLYWETSATIPDTDRTSLYISNAGIWEYVGGEMQSSSSTLADLPGGLGADDAGFRYRSSYFYRAWEWNGSAWHYADGGVGAGAQVATSGAAPSGGLWQACDGSTVACALDSATIGSLTASNTAASAGNNPMIEGGAGGSQQAAAAPQYAAPNTGNDSGSGTVVFAGVGTTVAAHTHTHVPPAINAPSESTGGLPLRVSMAWWMRR
jgi:hypothetical protein